MIQNQQEKQGLPKAVDLVGRPAQLYELHESSGEERKGTGLAQWLKPPPDRTIVIAARDVESALTYIHSHIPDFRVQSVTPRGGVLMVVERGS